MKKRRYPDQARIDIKRLLMMPVRNLIHEKNQYAAKDWLEYVFNPEQRHIFVYHAKRAFRMKGRLRPTMGIQLEAVNRLVAQGDQLFVRIDENLTDLIEVEHVPATTEETHIYTLSPDEWQTLVKRGCIEDRS